MMDKVFKDAVEEIKAAKEALAEQAKLSKCEQEAKLASAINRNSYCVLNDKMVYYCPHCERPVVENYFNFCPICGRDVQW
jgi:hypothetical protein